MCSDDNENVVDSVFYADFTVDGTEKKFSGGWFSRHEANTYNPALYLSFWYRDSAMAPDGDSIYLSFPADTVAAGTVYTGIENAFNIIYKEYNENNTNVFLRCSTPNAGFSLTVDKLDSKVDVHKDKINAGECFNSLYI